MKASKKEVIFGESALNMKLNIQNIKELKQINEMSFDNFISNKKINNTMNYINYAKEVEKNDDKSAKGECKVRDKEEEKKENYFYSNNPKISYQTINSLKFNLEDLKIPSINTEEKIYFQKDKSKEIKKQKRKNNRIGNNNASRIYILSILIITIIIKILSQFLLNNSINFTEFSIKLYNLSEKEINTFNKYKHQKKNNKNIIKSRLNMNNILTNEENMKNSNNLQFTNYSNNYLEKIEINNIIQNNRRYIFINKLYNIAYNNKLFISESNIKIYGELNFIDHKDIYNNIKNSNYEYYDSLIKNKKIYIYILVIIVLYLIIIKNIIFTKKIIINLKRKSINFIKKKQNNIIYLKKINEFLEVKRKNNKNYNLNEQNKLKIDDKKLEDIRRKKEKLIYLINQKVIYLIIVLFKIQK